MVSYEQPDYDGDLRGPEEHRHVVAVGDTIDIGAFTVHVPPANDADAIEPISYVLEHEAGRFFHGGDSRRATAFTDIGGAFDIDIGALALGSVGSVYDRETGSGVRTEWYMDENEVIDAAQSLQLDRLVPSHWDMSKGVGADPKVLHEHAASFPYPRTIKRATIGDRVRLSEPGIVPPTALRS